MLSVSVSLSRRMQAQNVYFCHFVSFCQIAPNSVKLQDISVIVAAFY